MTRPGTRDEHSRHVTSTASCAVTQDRNNNDGIERDDDRPDTQAERCGDATYIMGQDSQYDHRGEQLQDVCIWTYACVAGGKMKMTLMGTDADREDEDGECVGPGERTKELAWHPPHEAREETTAAAGSTHITCLRTRPGAGEAGGQEDGSQPDPPPALQALAPVPAPGSPTAPDCITSSSPSTP